MSTSAEQSWLALAHTLIINLPRIGYATQADQLQQLFAAQAHHAPADWALLQTVLEKLDATRGQMRVQDLAVHCALSRRQLERRVKRLFGLPPKPLARLIRFEHIRHRLLTEPTFDPLDLTYAYGYTDQSHFVRDFKALTGLTPRAFLARATQRNTTHFSYPANRRRCILPVISPQERHLQ